MRRRITMILLIALMAVLSILSIVLSGGAEDRLQAILLSVYNLLVIFCLLIWGGVIKLAEFRAGPLMKFLWYYSIWYGLISSLKFILDLICN